MEGGVGEDAGERGGDGGRGREPGVGWLVGAGGDPAMVAAALVEVYSLVLAKILNRNYQNLKCDMNQRSFLNQLQLYI
jgi:hypothetical protein